MGNRLSSTLEFLAIAGLIFGFRLFLIDEFSFVTPYFDDWGMGGQLQEYESDGVSIGFLLKPFNGHIGLWASLLQMFLFDLNQSQWDPHLQMVVNAVIWTLTGWLLIYIVNRYFDNVSKLAATSMLLLLWLFPVSIQNTTWGVQTHSYFMLLFSVAGIWFAQYDQVTKPWFAGLILLAMATLTMGGGAFAAIAVFGIALGKLILRQSSWQNIKFTFVASAVLSIYSLVVLKYSSSGHEVHYAKSFSDFFGTLFKSLSFPLHTQAWPSIIFLAPPLLLIWKTISHKLLKHKSASFTLTLFAFSLAICVAIAYARGAGGWPPNTRYYEFLLLYLVSSFFALLILQTPNIRLSASLNTGLITLWFLAFFAGCFHHISILSSDLKKRAVDKPVQDELFREYRVTNDLKVILHRHRDHIPFASPEGLEYFIKKVNQEENIWSYPLQVPPALKPATKWSAFRPNGTAKPSENWKSYKYRHENVVGSFIPANGGLASDGTFRSQLLSTNREQLMIPVTGYLGYPGLSLYLQDEETGDRTEVVPPELNSKYAERWQEIFVPAPENAFRLIATDANPKLWFGFAAPRTIGKLSVVTNTLINFGWLLWQISVCILIFTNRKFFVRLLRPSHIE